MHAQNTRGVNGNLNFTGQYSTVGGTSGLGFADFVTGQLSAFGQGRPFYDNDKSDYYGLYVQDAWRVGTHLTVNLGLRFEPYLPQRNTDGYVEAFSMTNFLAGKIGTPPVSNPVLTPPAGLIFPGDRRLSSEQPVQLPRESLAAPRRSRVGSVRRRQDLRPRVLRPALRHAAPVLLHSRLQQSALGRDANPQRRAVPAVEPLGRLSRRRSLRAEHRHREVLRILPDQRRLCRVRHASGLAPDQHLEPLDSAPVRQVAALGFVPGQPHRTPVVQPRAESADLHPRHLRRGTVRPDGPRTLLQHQRQQHRRAPQAHPRESRPGDRGTAPSHTSTPAPPPATTA